MAENENPSSKPDACRAGKSLFIWFLAGLALLTGLGYLAALHYPQQGVLVPVEQKSSRVDLLEQRIGDVEKRLDDLSSQPPPSFGDAAQINEEIKTLKALIEAKDVKNHRTPQDFVAAAFAFWDLREAAKTGKPFSLQLAALRSISKGDAKLSAFVDRLAPFAVAVPPTWNQLLVRLKAEEKNAPLPAAETETDSFKARALATLKSLITVRPLGDPRFTPLEKALDAADAVAATEALNALPPDARSALELWAADLKLRAELDETLQLLTVYFSTLSQEGNAP